VANVLKLVSGLAGATPEGKRSSATKMLFGLHQNAQNHGVGIAQYFNSYYSGHEILNTMFSEQTTIPGLSRGRPSEVLNIKCSE
jgi:hypothetical protein